MNRKPLFAIGRKRKRDYVRGFTETVEGRPLVRVQWTEGGKLKTESFDDTRNGKAKARAFAEGVHEQLHESLNPKPTPAFEPLTVRGLWEAYFTAKVDSWRPATVLSARGRWTAFELYVGKGMLAVSVTRERLDGFKRTLLATKTRLGTARSANQVRLTIDTVTAVFRWAVDRDLIAPTKVATYEPEFSKDAKRQVVEMAEFSGDERTKVLAALDPRDSRQWRAWVLTTLLAYCGPRQRAARLLEWSDIDLDAETIRWRAEHDKMASERVQPMPVPVVEAFWVAYGWRTTQRYTGALVFYSPKGERSEAYGAQAYIHALHAAERRAGVGSVKYRAAHGFRRGIAGDVHAATGSEKAAADWIGDRSVKVVRRHYLLGRDEELRKTAALVGGGQSAAEASGANPNERERGSDEGAPSVSCAPESNLNREPQDGFEPSTARSQVGPEWTD